MIPKIRVVILEYELLIRKSLSLLVNQSGKLEVRAESRDGKELLDLLKNITVDVILFDLNKPFVYEQETILVLKKKYPNIKIIVLSSDYHENTIKQCLASGADSFLNKNCLPDELIQTIIKVYENGFTINVDLSEKLLKNYLSRQRIDNSLYPITKREKEILRELCNGNSEKEIALKLNISVHTVHFHRKNLYNKTASHNLAGLLRYERELDFKV